MVPEAASTSGVPVMPEGSMLPQGSVLPGTGEPRLARQSVAPEVALSA